MRKHQITNLSQAQNDTLDFCDCGHDLFLPDPKQNATLYISCLDDSGNVYNVTSIPVSAGQTTTYFLDPSKTPFTSWIQWELKSGNSTNAPNLPYSFRSKKHDAPI